jgi:hypothetical protein
LLFGQNEDELETVAKGDEVGVLSDAALGRLPSTGLIPFPEIADALDEVPWDVLMACRRLARLGLAREGKGKERGAFGRV